MGQRETVPSLNDGRQYELRIDLFDWEGEHRYAKYSQFSVAPESDNYRLTVSGYTGNAGGDSFEQNGNQFTTVDRDNDNWPLGNCASAFGSGGGYWWSNCGLFTPNGRYSRTSNAPRWSAVHWFAWRGQEYSLKKVSMAFRYTD